MTRATGREVHGATSPPETGALDRWRRRAPPLLVLVGFVLAGASRPDHTYDYLYCETEGFLLEAESATCVEDPMANPLGCLVPPVGRLHATASLDDDWRCAFLRTAYGDVESCRELP